MLLSSGLQASFDADWAAGRITWDSYRNGSEDGVLAYKLLIQTGSKKDPFNFSQVRILIQYITTHSKQRSDRVRISCSISYP